MKSPFRVFVVVLLASAAAPLLVWIGTFAYWHLKIRWAIRTLEVVPNAQQRTKAHEVFDSAGCRRLPYLVGALDASRDQAWLWNDLVLYFGWIAPADKDAALAVRLLEESELRSSDSLEQRREKCERVRAWWRQTGPDFHRWWKVWSSDCCPRH